MKTMRLFKIAALILGGFLMTAQLQALNEKFTRDIRHAVRIELGKSMTDQITVTFELNRNEVLNILGLLDVHSGNLIEDWMTNPEYLDQPIINQNVECWMLDDDYLELETRNVESWMMDSSYLDDQESVTGVETWMLNPAYLAKK